MTPIHVVTQGPRIFPCFRCTTDEGEKVSGGNAVYLLTSTQMDIHHSHSYPIGHTSHMANPTTKVAWKCRELMGIDKHSGHCHNYYLPHLTVEATEILRN